GRSAAGLEALLAHPLRQLGGVDQVAVVAERDAAARVRGLERRLGVLPPAATGGGVATVTDGDVAFQRGQHLLVEDLGDQPEVLEDHDLRAVAHRDARGFLAAMLQCVEAVVGQFGDFFTPSPDTEYAAFLPRLGLKMVSVCARHLSQLLRERRRPVQASVRAFRPRRSRSSGVSRACHALAGTHLDVRWSTGTQQPRTTFPWSSSWSPGS